MLGMEEIGIYFRGGFNMEETGISFRGGFSMEEIGISFRSKEFFPCLKAQRKLRADSIRSTAKLAQNQQNFSC